MSKPKKESRPEARLPKGFQDLTGEDLRATHRMLGVIREVYERYGYEPLETPAFEYTDALGKFLPDQDRPNAGVFSLQDEDEQWLSLRYDLTAPLARYVAENYDRLPKPYRRYAMGPVWRNEKPGPGRFRQFMQCDADTVGTESVAADAEACMLMADVITALGLPADKFRIRINNRKLLDGLLAVCGIDPVAESDAARRLTVLRAMDKFDKFGTAGVSLLLGAGRKDESGDFTQGAGLDAAAIRTIVGFLEAGSVAEAEARARVAPLIAGNATAEEGLKEIEEIEALVRAAGYGTERITFDPSVVRGLDYYTGPVFEAELTFEVKNEDGQTVRFGSVGGGGRYDDLVARFTGQRVPATGFSLGLSRLQSALSIMASRTAQTLGPVVVLVMDRGELPRYQRMAHDLRNAGVRAELYLGTSGMKAQMRYADRRAAPCVIIQGSDERAKGEVQIKDLIEGAKAAAAIKDNAEWKATRPAQVSVPEAQLVAAVKEILARHGGAA
ncbi:MAG: histidine--tRNA ligase [Hyphomicrobiaceae bacterium]